MTDWLISLSKKIPFLKINSYYEAVEAVCHFFFGAFWASFFSHFCRLSSWWFLSAIPLIAFTLYKELFEDGHLRRMLDKTESKDERKDFITDLVTRLLGLVFYLMVLV